MLLPADTLPCFPVWAVVDGCTSDGEEEEGGKQYRRVDPQETHKDTVKRREVVVLDLAELEKVVAFCGCESETEGE